MGYSVPQFGRMLADGVRMRAYHQALAHSVSRDSVVLDIGAGTGILSLLACQLGARRVYAVEPGDALVLARASAQRHGFEDRMICIQSTSDDITLPEKATIVVSDLRGTTPLHGSHLHTIMDARKRLLAQGGVQLPVRDTIHVALAAAPDTFRRNVEVFEKHSFPLDLSDQRQFAANSPCVPQRPLAQLWRARSPWTTLDYTTLTTPHASGAVTFTIDDPGTAHGLVLWFEATVAEGITYTTSPEAEPTVYANMFLPFLAPIDLRRGDTAVVDLTARHLHGSYVWIWNTRVFDRNDPATTRIHFRQSSFQGEPLSHERLVRRSPTAVVKPGEKGRIVRELLAAMEAGTASNRALAAMVFESHPQHFKSLEDALTLVSDIAASYGA